MKQLFRKDFTLVVIGQIISLFGNNILRFALPLYVFEETGSAMMLGVVSAAAFVPMVIMSPVGGIIADRVNKQRIMVALDTITAIMLGLFMLLMNTISMIPLVIVSLMLLYGIQGAYTPAVHASMPLLAQEDMLVSANAVVNLVNSLASLLGPVIGGVLFGKFGLWPILAVSCGCFAFSAILELFIKIPFQKRPKAQSVWQLIKGDLSESAVFITKTCPIIGKVIALLFAFNLFISSMLLVGLPVIIRGYLGISSELYGISQGALGVGGLLGGLLAGTLGRKLKLRNTHYRLLLCAATALPMCLVLILGVPSFTSFIVFAAMPALFMVSGQLFSIQMLAFVQGITPSELVGKVLSLIMMVGLCAQPLGQALYGFLFEHFAAVPWVVMTGSAIIALGISAYSRGIFGKLPESGAVSAN